MYLTVIMCIPIFLQADGCVAGSAEFYWIDLYSLFYLMIISTFISTMIACFQVDVTVDLRR